MRSGTMRIIKLLIFFLAAWLLLKYLLPLCSPFLLGTGLALAAEPMVRFFRRQLKLPRAAASGIAVSMSFCFLGILALLLCALLIRELRNMAGVLPGLAETARSGVGNLENWLLELSSHTPESIAPILRHNIETLFSDGASVLDRAVGYLLGLAGTILSHIPDSALGIGTAVISGYMISAKLPAIQRRILKILPREKLRSFLTALKRVRSTLSCWLLAQLKLSAVTFSLLLGGFLILRVPYAPVWALVVSLVDAFPVLGTGTVLLPWAIISLLQKNTARALGLAGIYTVVCITRSVLEPRLLGKHLGLDPLVTLFAMYAGFKLWGIVGMILAPILAVTALQLRPEEKHEK